ncbi:hypothetical protein BpHYR1_044515 [Brachionus plicatilis]|uniref:Uncharacterized protein n=1 Tax=Brachionus plicatilis TaxID=10195 RepID=A0A3M7SZ19_BRAPC|nr:hypothetical protein BpHYR1_044515 [Brachionus plicatilis]
MPPMMQNGQGRRFDQSNNFNQNLNQMPPQQQAMLAAQLSAFAMAANMGGMNGPMYEQGMPMPNKNQGRNERGGRNFNRRNGVGNNRAAQREDPSPFPGFDPKRARY